MRPTIKTTPIRDYALIGNLRTAALISRRGSVDWLPAPWMDSPSVFAAILDLSHGGHWSIQPADSTCESSQEYEEDTAIIKTRFTTASGVLEVTDFMSIPEKASDPFSPACQLYRRVRCIRGTCDVKVTWTPRFDYARGTTAVSTTPYGLLAQHAMGIAQLFTNTLPWRISRDEAIASWTLRAGEQSDFIMRVVDSNAVLNTAPPFDATYQQTRHFWKKQKLISDTITVDHLAPEWQAAVRRSLITLKLLFCEPYGTFAAAPTTSLPETVGGVRNWDYRYNWIRDTAIALQTLIRWDHVEEAEQYWAAFKQHAAPDIIAAPQSMQCIYGLKWQRDLEEEILPHLKGYANSQPVRIGNGAYHQRQWDNYGVLLDFIWSLYRVRPDEVSDDVTWKLVQALAHHVVKIWQEADEGIWEVRGGARHFVYSKVMCWVALDRARSLALVLGHIQEAQQWQNEAETLHAEILLRGWNSSLQAFTQSFDDATALDASILRLPAMGFVEGRDPRMTTTIERVEQGLSVGDGLLLRYRTYDGLEGHEGAFLITSFWLVDALMASGNVTRARALLDTLIASSNHLGLYAEEIEPKSGTFLGNFPQGYSHIGLLNSMANVLEIPAVATHDTLFVQQASPLFAQRSVSRTAVTP